MGDDGKPGYRHLRKNRRNRWDGTDWSGFCQEGNCIRDECDLLQSDQAAGGDGTKIWLRAGRLSGVAGASGLDVFEAEPVITPELFALDNVVLTPHNATGTIDTRIEIAGEAAENILRYFDGRKDISIVNPVVWEK